MDERLKELFDLVRPLDGAAVEAARERQAKLAKPPGRLGKLESASIRLAGITGHAYLELCDAVTMEDPWIRSEL